MLISDTIRKKRREKEISQGDISRNVGMSRVRYIGFEKGRGKISEAELFKIFNEVGLTITFSEKNG